MWLGVVAFVVAPTAAHERRVQISGTITTTLTIFEDAELTGDVTCEVEGAPCLAFGAPNIRLRLNGFTVRGRVEPPTGCVSIADFFTKLEDGISIVGQSGVALFGPGRVENFARYGVFAMSSSAVTIRRVTAADNCFSGIQVWTVSDSEVTENVSARNAMGSEAFPCGGI
jgi:hypothetical protein